jgi:hypothetical protein
MKVIAIAALALIGAPVDANDVENVIRKLDLTGFPNSLSPGRSSARTSFADYGFVTVARAESGATLARKSDDASKSFVVISNDQTLMRLCFHDSFVRQIGPMAHWFTTTTALMVTKSPGGRWTAEEVPGGFPSCHNRSL